MTIHAKRSTDRLQKILQHRFHQPKRSWLISSQELVVTPLLLHYRTDGLALSQLRKMHLYSHALKITLPSMVFLTKSRGYMTTAFHICQLIHRRSIKLRQSFLLHHHGEVQAMLLTRYSISMRWLLTLFSAYMALLKTWILPCSCQGRVISDKSRI